MNKILLIEDRPGRQAQFLNNNLIHLLEAKPFLTVPKEANCRALIEDINSNNTLSLIKYSLIMIHKSSLNQIGLKALETLCNTNNIDLILFSGGLSQHIYAKDKHQSLSMNSKEFYNNNLASFLEKYSKEKTTSLLELVYEAKWKLELLMRYRLLKTKENKEDDYYVKIMLEEETKGIEKITGISPDDVNSQIDKLIAAI